MQRLVRGQSQYQKFDRHGESLFVIANLQCKLRYSFKFQRLCSANWLLNFTNEKEKASKEEDEDLKRNLNSTKKSFHQKNRTRAYEKKRRGGSVRDCFRFGRLELHLQAWKVKPQPLFIRKDMEMTNIPIGCLGLWASKLVWVWSKQNS